MDAAPRLVTARQTASPVEAFSGAIARTKTGPIYVAGLAIVAFAMVLLPLIYLALIAFTCWAVFLHLKNDTWIFDGPSGRGEFSQFLLYLSPAVVGCILIFFLVKPLFAAKARAPEPITLDPAKEPLLFAFVEKICGLVGAPMPCRIDVDCQVNASASLRHGLWSRWSQEFVLTIGLPLAAGLDMRQFAGVLAHEFGHFAQGAGMRLTYVIRNVNSWFTRVVYERDAWDKNLVQDVPDWRVGIMLNAARGCIWLTRRILWVLMSVGHAISCFMLRQMEYDADSYEVKLAGSDAFEPTIARLRTLNVAAQAAYEDVRQSWASKRLPESLPLLIDHKAGSLPRELQQKLSASAASQKTRWFDTHPCDADRIRAAQRQNEQGVFRFTERATLMFRDFAELSKTVTRHQYEKNLKLEFTEQNLVSTEEILRESAASAQADAMARKYYGKIDISLRPLLETGALPTVANDENAVAKWREARQATETLLADAEQLSAECNEHRKQLDGLRLAHSLAKAGFRLELGAYGLPLRAATCREQENAARLALEETNAALVDRFARLDQFMAALRERVILALRLGQTNEASEVAELARLLAAVGAELPRAYELGSRRNAFAVLAQNLDNHSNPAEVEKVASEVVSELRTLIGGIQGRLKQFAYPFQHARGRLTVAEYARFEKPAENDWQRAYLDSGAHMERLFALHYRLVGRILALVDTGEATLEKRQLSPES